MNDPLFRLNSILKQNGYSTTMPRSEVFRFLHGKEPVALSAIADALKEKVNRASVNRTVALFQRLGIIRRENVGWKYTIELSDDFSGHHHHLTCAICGKVAPINEKALERFVEKLAMQYGFQATGHQVELQGYCSDCRRDA